MGGEVHQYHSGDLLGLLVCHGIDLRDLHCGHLERCRRLPGADACGVLSDRVVEPWQQRMVVESRHAILFFVCVFFLFSYLFDTHTIWLLRHNGVLKRGAEVEIMVVEAQTRGATSEHVARLFSVRWGFCRSGHWATGGSDIQGVLQPVHRLELAGCRFCKTPKSKREKRFPF